MATEAQINANRSNAQKSTGPRTARGKEVVSQNAVKHGLCAKKNVIRTESQEEFDLFCDEMIEDLAPAGGMELMLAKRIVNLAWRLRRAEYFQNVLVEALIDCSMHDGRSFMDFAQNEARAGNFDLITGYAVKRDFADARSLDLFLLYEKRIESSLFKVTAEFRKTQRLRRENVSWASARLSSPKSSPRMRGGSTLGVPEGDARDTFSSETSAQRKECEAKEKQNQFAGLQPEMLNSATDVDMTGPASPEYCFSGRNSMKPESVTNPASSDDTYGTSYTVTSKANCFNDGNSGVHSKLYDV